MPSARETMMAALETALLGTEAVVWRSTDLARAIPPEGLITILEGDGDTEISLSPISHVNTQNVELVVDVTAADEHARDAAMDALLVMVDSVLTTDRTLGGACGALIIMPPAFEAVEADGAAKRARVPLQLVFTSGASPLA